MLLPGSALRAARWRAGARLRSRPRRRAGPVSRAIVYAHEPRWLPGGGGRARGARLRELIWNMYA